MGCKCGAHLSCMYTALCDQLCSFVAVQMLVYTPFPCPLHIPNPHPHLCPRPVPASNPILILIQSCPQNLSPTPFRFWPLSQPHPQCPCCLQGLLSAMAAKVRSKQRHLASTGPSLLQFTSTRTAADKALKNAETACEAALQTIAGTLLLMLCLLCSVQRHESSTGSSSARLPCNLEAQVCTDLVVRKSGSAASLFLSNMLAALPVFLTTTRNVQT